MPSPYKENVPLAPLSTMKVGGPARYFITVRTVPALAKALAFASKRDVPVFIIGGGSNILITDTGYPGLVIKLVSDMIEFSDYGNDRVLVVADAGVVWDDLVQKTVDRGLWGLENLSHIPGTIGAAPVQNVGAYGAEVADTLAWVRVYDSKRNATYLLTHDECGFGYRDSIFKRPEGRHLVILSAAFILKKKGVPNIHYKDVLEYFGGKQDPRLHDVRRAIIAIRSGKFPPLSDYGTAGSFFKNPIISEEHYYRLKERYPGIPGFQVGERAARAGGVKVPLAWILDSIGGWKGFRKGNVGTYKNQPLVIVNYHAATAAEIRALSRAIAEDVYSKTGIAIEPEVSFVG